MLTSVLDILDLLDENAAVADEFHGFSIGFTRGYDKKRERAERTALKVVDRTPQDVEVDAEFTRSKRNDGFRHLAADEGKMEQVHIVAAIEGARGIHRIDDGLRQIAGHYLADERARGFGLRTRKDVDHVAFLNNFALIHDDYAAADLLHDVHFMRDHDDRDAEFLINALQELQGGDGGFGVERRGCFVRQKHFRVVCECAGDADALLLAA